MSWTETELAYMAGMIDGEGTITIFVHDHRIRLILCVYNTSKKGIEWIHSRFGGRLHESNRSKSVWKKCYVWETGWKHAAEVIKKVRPYLVIKSEQADLFLACAETMSRRLYCRKVVPNQIRDLRISYSEQIRLLNKRGSHGSLDS